MKYNVPLEIKENDSLSMLLKHINPGSTVLEFGCANGRMTKYMTEALECKVYIVEYEEEAYKEAVAYAAGGLCSDIMKFEWETYFNFKFDYVVFADVLEHLSNPKAVIAATQKVLKDNGKLLVSVPNIGHNDILIKLMYEKFEYTNIGLLDDTHIHFFALKGLKEFFNESGYIVEQLGHTTIPTGNTEQFWNERCYVDNTIRNALNERKSGEIYQFIVCAHKRRDDSDIQEDLGEITTPMINGKLYLDTGAGFNENETIKLSCYARGNGVYEFKDRISLSEGVRKVRFDLLEGQECYVMNNNIVVDKGISEIKYGNNIQTDQGILLLGKDPFFEVILDNNQSCYLDCEITFVVAGDYFIEQLIKETLEIQDKYFFAINQEEKTRKELEECRRESIQKFESYEKKLKDYKKEKEQELSEKEQELKEKDEIITSMQAEKEMLIKQREKFEQREKEMSILCSDYQAVISMRQREMRELKLLLDYQAENTKIVEGERDQLEYQLKLMEATVSWRITKGLRAVRRRFGRK